MPSSARACSYRCSILVASSGTRPRQVLGAAHVLLVEDGAGQQIARGTLTDQVTGLADRDQTLPVQRRRLVRPPRLALQHAQLVEHLALAVPVVDPPVEEQCHLPQSTDRLPVAQPVPDGADVAHRVGQLPEVADLTGEDQVLTGDPQRLVVPAPGAQRGAQIVEQDVALGLLVAVTEDRPRLAEELDAPAMVAVRVAAGAEVPSTILSRSGGPLRRRVRRLGAAARWPPRSGPAGTRRRPNS